MREANKIKAALCPTSSASIALKSLCPFLSWLLSPCLILLKWLRRQWWEIGYSVRSEGGRGCWASGGAACGVICIWGEAFTSVRLGRWLGAREQWECVWIRASWQGRVRLPANCCDCEMPVIKLESLCCFLFTASLPVCWSPSDMLFPSLPALHVLRTGVPVLASLTPQPQQMSAEKLSRHHGTGQ